MPESLSRRDALKQLGAVGAGFVLGDHLIRGRSTDIVIAGQPVEIAVASLSAATVRLTIRPLKDGRATPVPLTGALVQEEPGRVLARARSATAVARVSASDLVVKLPLALSQ